MPTQPEESSRPLLAIQGYCIAAAGVQLLRGVSFQLLPGELVGLSGPSGCGKTTLLRAIAGLIDPAAGHVRYSGRTPAEIGWPLFRRNVLLVNQRPALLEGSVLDSLRRPFSYREAPGAFQQEQAEALLERLLVGNGRMNQEARSLSVGQQQRVCLARGLLLQPKVMLLDEPTSALDDAAEAAVETAIREEAETRGMAAVIVSHDREQTARWCTRAVDLTPYRAEGAAQ